jgi:hypothetical protein
MVTGMTPAVPANVIREVFARFGNAGFGSALGAVHEKDGKLMGSVF